MQPTIVVIVAYAFEARAAASVARDMTRKRWGAWTLSTGEMWNVPVAIIRCGPGKAAAAAAAQAAIGYFEPIALLSFGMAGSPDVDLRAGSLVVPNVVLDVALGRVQDLPVEMPVRFEPEADLLAELLDVPGTRPAWLACWEGQVASPAHRPPVEARGQRIVVDWESAAIAHVASLWDVPWAALKVVSDHGEPERLRSIAANARRPLHWAAEVLRRACVHFAEKRVTTQEILEPGGADGEAC
ncbi:MAG: 5'-methylthioadenosine/S-adenosylhomocysteine nucleosidase [Acidobacteria bacterium]|nr:5'-methylthioadenosine/S-adenosylhomocysteine nucleosidase [Acidobacteriota bacterium]